MEISREEAEQSLAEIERITHRTRRSIAASGASVMLIIWGLIWVIGYGGSQFYPARSTFIWLPLCLLGGLISWWVGTRPRPVRGKISGKIAAFWLVLFAFAGIWIFLLQPADQNRVGAFMGTIPMFAYIVGGLWFSRFFVVLGITVTGLILLGAFSWPAWTNLWTGLAGGGSLILSGIYIHFRWR
jgi:hypothetical protein